jgi:hypothetical protein
MTQKEKALALNAAKKEIRLQLKAARDVCRRKHKTHQRYLELKRTKKKLIRSVQNELTEMLVSFRTLRATMREAEQALRGTINTREQQSKQFLAGLEAGREEARMLQRQAQLDQQSQNTKGIQQ